MKIRLSKPVEKKVLPKGNTDRPDRSDFGADQILNTIRKGGFRPHQFDDAQGGRR